MLVSAADAFSSSFSAPNDALPNGRWTMPALSTRYSILPALSSLTALPTSNVTVPSFGFGMRPRGPRIFPIRPTSPIRSGVATALSKSSHPSWIFLTRSSPPMKSAPASLASRSLSPFAKTATRTDRPVPCGSTTVPRTFWSACRGSTPSRTASSSVSSNLAVASLAASPTASSRAYRVSRFTAAVAAFNRLPSRAMPCPLFDHVEPDAARRSLDGPHRRFQRFRRQIRPLERGDLAHLGAGDRADLAALRIRRALFDASGLLQQHRGGRRLGHERERAIRVHGDDHRNDHAGLRLGLGVERLA